MLSTSKVGGISFYMHINIKKRPKPSSKEERLWVDSPFLNGTES